MVGKDRMCRHLLERVLRQYDYVQTIPGPLTTIAELAPKEVVMAFMEFLVHVLSEQERGDVVPKDEVWKHPKGYMKWFYRVSHPIMIAPTAVPEYTTPVPAYEEVIVEKQ